MKNNIYIIENFKDLEFLKKNNLINQEVYLLSSNFSFEDISKYKNLKFYDEFITAKESNFLSNQINKIYSQYFIDCLNIKTFNEFNPGMIFQGSIRILLTTFLKYNSFINKKLLNSKKKIFISPNSNKFFLSLLMDYKNKVNYNFLEFKSISSSLNLLKINHLEFDIDSRFRNHNFFKNMSQILYNIFTYIILIFNKIKIYISKDKNIVYFSNIDKVSVEDLIKIYSDKLLLIDINKSNLLKYLFNKKIIFMNNIFIKKKDIRLSIFRNIFLKALKKNYFYFDLNVIEIFEKYLFCYFDYYYFNYNLRLKFISHYKNLSTIVSCSDSHELSTFFFNLGKKLNLNNLITPHGIFDDDFYLNYKFKYINGALAHGSQQYNHFLKLGLKKDSISKINFPHYDKFLKSKSSSGNVRKAIILAYEMCNYYPHSELRKYFDYYFNLIYYLKHSKYKQTLIKVRSQFHYPSFNFLEIFCKKNNIKFATGYSKLSNFLVYYNVVIGPKSTAIFETLLLGKEYYLISNDQKFKTIKSSLIYFNNNNIYKLYKKSFLPILANKKYDINFFVYNNTNIS